MNSPVCEPWVSHAFNSAVMHRVDRLRAVQPASTDPCGDRQTAFERVIDYQVPEVVDGEKLAADARARASREVHSDAHRIRLNEILVVRVQHLQTLWERANCIDRARTAAEVAKSGGTAPPVTIAGCTKRDIQLFIDGRPIAGLTPESGAPDIERRSGTLRYHLARTSDSKEHWADLIGLDLQQASPFDRMVKISVGLADAEPINTAVTSFKLVRIRGRWLVGWIVLTGLFLLVLYRWVTRTDLLRDRYPVVEYKKRRPYSLAQCQAAWWTVLTLIGFVFIWLVTGERDFSGSALALLGITAGTVMGARIIDASRESGDSSDPAQAAQAAARKTAIDTAKDLEAALAKADIEHRQNPTDPVADAAYKAALQAYAAHIAQVRKDHPGVVAEPSNGWLRDVLSDARGVSFHRFQMAAWALILGLMFVVEVMARLGMPDFDANLLGLLGISSGTYLGLKIPEQR